MDSSAILPRRSGLAAVAVIGLTLTASLCGCDPPKPAPAEPPVSDVPPPGSATSRSFDFQPIRPPEETQTAGESSPLRSPQFEDVADPRGIRHQYDNGASPKALMVESTGGGCGWIDYDRDGLLDLYLTQGGIPDAKPEERAQADVLSRQLVTGQFVSAEVSAAIDERGFGHGVAVGDVDNDGFDDVFVANVGANSLWLNQGDGTFLRATGWLVGDRDVWSSSAAWGDIDRDGDLDLYVCNYAIYDPYDPIQCLDKDGVPSICHPRNVEPEPDVFFLNSGDGQLKEMSQQFQLFGPGNKGLGVVIADLTADGWPDIYVANDTTANFVFVNNGGRSFTESALLLGGGFSATGATQASMGIGFGDYDRNQLPDLCLTHFTGESNTLYQNLGAQGLQDVSGMTGLREASLAKLGFGIVMSDFNADDRMDLMIANGHIDPRYADGEGYQMTPQMLSWDGRRWQDLSAESGSYFQRPCVGRGVASADFDADGWLDLCVVHHNSPTALLHNTGHDGHFLRVGCNGRTSNRSGYGATIRLEYDGKARTREIAGGTSYAASHERVVDFGLGDWPGPCSLTITWPSGIVDAISLDQVDQLVVVQEGTSWEAHPRQ